MFIFHNIFRRYNSLNYNSFFDIVYLWQKNYMIHFYKSLSALFNYKSYSYYVNIIRDAYLYNLVIQYKKLPIRLHYGIYHIPTYVNSANTAISLLLKSFSTYYNILYSMLYVIYFNLILKRNTAFLQCVSGSNDIIFTTTSTQFGFKKYKRYARFIVEFFLLLSFSYVLDFGLHNIAFKIKLLNYFKYTHIIKKFIYGVKSFRFRFYCRDTSEERKRYSRFLKLEKYSELKYKYQFLYFFVHNSIKSFKIKFNLVLKSQVYNLLSELCGLFWFTMLYFQHALEVPNIVSRASLKYFFRPFYLMFNIHGFGAYAYDFEYFIVKLYYIVKFFFFNFFFFKNIICVLLLFYNRFLNFRGLHNLQKRFLTRLSYNLFEYTSNYLNFNVLKNVTILYFLILIKLKLKKLNTYLSSVLLFHFIVRFLYILFKNLFLFFYNKISINLGKNVLLYKFSKHAFDYNLKPANYFYKRKCAKYKNKDLDYTLRYYNLLKYYFKHPNYIILHVFKDLQDTKDSFKNFWRSYYMFYFKKDVYIRSSYLKFLNSGDGLDVPYVIIKQVLPFGGGCKLSKIRRKKVRSYKHRNRFIGNYI